MRRSRGHLVAGSVASVVLFLLSVGHAAGSASDPPSHSLRASKGSPAQVKTPKAYSRQVPRRLNSPEGILLKDLKRDRKSTRLNSSHGYISYAVFCLKKKKKK